MIQRYFDEIETHQTRRHFSSLQLSNFENQISDLSTLCHCTFDTTSNQQPHFREGPTSADALSKPFGMIHIGKDMWLREEVWRKIHSTTKDSLFVKELAVAIWGTVELRGRSVSGKECPTKNTEAKPPLSHTSLESSKSTSVYG
ncbi:BEN domain-containing protein 5-like isoform X2 [Micropterus dolomieu]|uniref:BEN domain-containing protein 5-like isoform X2 n=1 Tax=Micropterus dolomieu TaxID=147949 RepID=UPI001E8CD019|nr:BEN domain-containing protein 5-like isoform X2 [Micropterus dolomieu]